VPSIFLRISSLNNLCGKIILSVALIYPNIAIKPVFLKVVAFDLFKEKRSWYFFRFSAQVGVILQAPPDPTCEENSKILLSARIFFYTVETGK